MKSRQRFFDVTVLKKDITRFCPVWALYLIGGLLLAITILNNGYTAAKSFDTVTFLNACTGYFGIISLVYGLIVAQLLYGDLFNSKLCNALHAMPLRREGWFVTHAVSGLLFSLVPNFCIALVTIPFLGEYWYVAFLWLLGMQMHYLFFFGIAVLCMFLSGNRFAAALLYVIICFISVLVIWFLSTMYLPLMYGIQLSESDLVRWCPIVKLFDEPSYFSATHLDTCPCYRYTNYVSNPLAKDVIHESVWGGLGSSWGYLTILAVCGLVFLGLALLLYRRRALESAGDFVAFSPLRPVFRVVFALCAGGAMQAISMMLGEDDFVGYIFLAIGLICGYVVSYMLVERTVKVFKLRMLRRMGLFLLAFCLSLGITKLDPLGIVSYVPEADQVKTVYISNNYYQTTQLEARPGRDCIFVGTTAADIEKARNAHSLLLSEGEAPVNSLRESFMIHYVLKNGSTVTRYYACDLRGDAAEAAYQLLAQPQSVFGVDSLEALVQRVENVTVSYTGHYYPKELTASLLEALWKDAENGCLVQSYDYHEYIHRDNGKYYDSLVLYFTDAVAKELSFSRYYLNIYDCCENTIAWMEKNLASQTLFDIDPDLVLGDTGCFMDQEGIFYTHDTARKLADALWADYKNGDACQDFPLWDDSLLVHVYSQEGVTYPVYISTTGYTYQLLWKYQNRTE